MANNGIGILRIDSSHAQNDNATHVLREDTQVLPYSGLAWVKSDKRKQVNL